MNVPGHAPAVVMLGDELAYLRARDVVTVGANLDHVETWRAVCSCGHRGRVTYRADAARDVTTHIAGRARAIGLAD